MVLGAFALGGAFFFFPKRLENIVVWLMKLQLLLNTGNQRCGTKVSNSKHIENYNIQFFRVMSWWGGGSGWLGGVGFASSILAVDFYRS